MLTSTDSGFEGAAQGGHLPVLLDETLDLLDPGRGSYILDGTFGGGGHARAFLEAAEGVCALALDCDPDAEKRAEFFAETYGERFRFLPLNFGELETLDASDFDGVFFDFGLSSFQLDAEERGFSFRHDAPVDMRMNPRSGRSASEFLETAEESELVRAIRDYGEERRWRRVVRAIQEARGTGRLERTGSLAELLAGAVGPGRPGRKELHPATRSFQGIRIYINDELSSIERALPAAFEKLKPGGVLAAISFHSLEDRIVKRFCRRMAGRPEHGRDSRPQETREVRAELPVTRPVRPSEEEIRRNPRSRSARLRAVRKKSNSPTA
ncbi:MAG: 16S rRNA (cytosine(1402)-N(4))-methyltransferase RsmH [Opitutales bacterium]